MYVDRFTGGGAPRELGGQRAIVLGPTPYLSKSRNGDAVAIAIAANKG